MVDHGSYIHNLSSCAIKAWKNSGLNGTRTHDPCDAVAVLYRLNYQAIWELVTLWVRNIPVEGEECKWIYGRSYIWNAEKDMNLWLIIVVIHTTWTVVKLKLKNIQGWIRTHDLCDTIYIFHLLRVYYELTMWPAPRWLESLVGRALHRYRRGHEFESRSKI